MSMAAVQAASTLRCTASLSAAVRKNSLSHLHRSLTRPLLLTVLLCAACTGNPPAKPTHGTFNCPSTRHGDVCTAVCDQGYAGVATSACSLGSYSTTITGACTPSSACYMQLLCLP